MTFGIGFFPPLGIMPYASDVLLGGLSKTLFEEEKPDCGAE
jgi:hypothetical protein